MLVRDLMKKSPKSCGPGSNLAEVTELLWSGGCGALPVVDSKGNVAGVITDRDICVALGTGNRRPAEVLAGETMSRQVATCHTTDDIHTALATMQGKKVHRLPVVDAEGKLQGILCISDLILNARHDDGNRPQLSYEDIMNALRGIYCHHSFCTCGSL